MSSLTLDFQFPPAPRILVRGTNWLGDAVMTTPALLRLREKFPGAHITILTPEKLKDLWKNHPAIDEIISFASGKNLFFIAKKLRKSARGDARPTKFDLALVLPNSPRSAIEVFLAGIPQRIGHARPWRNFFLTQIVAPRADAVKMRKRSIAEIRALVAADVNRRTDRAFTSAATSAHQIHEYLHLAAALGANPEPLPPKLFVTPEEIEAVNKKFGLDKISDLIFGLNPGAEYGPAKRWPVEKFISAAKEIQRQTNCAWILFGGKNDLPITNQIESAICNPQSAVFNLAGKTSLRELMALLKHCRVLLTNDTGPMHVAAALGVRVVAIFGSTSPELTGPIFSSNATILKSDAPCSPCFLRECPIDFRCMNGIGVEKVVEAAVKLLNG
ncbi:MAG TPA: lipopolysaccharide heptosyltransferase II [Verrucomicrobiae bacterium]|jgi:heptosyltransferase-2|nr:lipopolysaccharide heptosyltransferase II [Verrucomicrobiae bacterium]